MILDAAARGRFERRVRRLEAFGHRGSATDAEHRAADYLIDELDAAGITAQREPFPGQRSLGARILVHVLVAAVGVALLWVFPWITVLLGIGALISFAAEAGTRHTMLTRLLRTSPSGNVVGRITPGTGNGPRRRVIVCAHVDTQRTGLIWSDRVVKRLTPLLQKVPGPLKSPTFPIMLAMLAQAIVGMVAVLSPGNPVCLVAGGVILVLYGLAGLVLAEWSIGNFSPGACDNASGVSAAVSLAEGWGKSKIDDAELVILLSGCEETGALGAAAWLDAHRSEIQALPTSFLNLDTLGYGSPRFLGLEYTMAAIPKRYPDEILQLCQTAAQRMELAQAGPHTLPVGSDATAFLSRGIPGATVTTFEDGGYVPNYHQMTDTSDRMSFDVGWQATRFAAEILEQLALRPGPGQTTAGKIVSH